MAGKGPRIAVLSGKGGAGKTFTAVNLAAATGGAVYVDCDAEEPDGHLFFRPQVNKTDTVSTPVPQVDAGACTGCRTCVDFCRFHALAWAAGKVLLFEDVCHGCGACALLCPERAVTERPRPVGTVTEGVSGDVAVWTGTMLPGAMSGMAIIRRLVKGMAGEARPVFIDCPPGSGCAVGACVNAADYCVLVVEPTRFGVHDLAMVEELVTLHGKPFGYIINKYLPGENPADVYCRGRSAPVLARIPFDPALGVRIADGHIPAREDPAWRVTFQDLYNRIREETGHAAVDSQR